MDVLIICYAESRRGLLVFADADRRMTFAYVMNKMGPGVVDPIATALVERLYGIVKR